jgi:hypothetical protein
MARQTAENLAILTSRLGVQWLELRQYLHDMRDRLDTL